MIEKLPPHQYRLIKALGTGGDKTTVEQLVALSGVDQALISAAAVELASAGYTEIEEQPYTELRLGELGAAIGRGEAELPERLLARALLVRQGSATVKDLMDDKKLVDAGIQPGKFAKKLVELNWATFDQGTLTLINGAENQEPSACDIEAALTAVHVSGGVMNIDSKSDPRILSGVKRLKGRKELLVARDRSRKYVSLTYEGKLLAAQVAGGTITELIEASELTPEMLSDGSWRKMQFRQYDVSLSAEKAVPGKSHPLVRVIEQTRLAFLELGFTEASCPMAEMAFWDFDALFQPQDHPAREMQDTFYCKTPSSYPLPDQEIVERVRQTHEDGWETGSRGWRYKWSPERAAQVVLRTHMTASSIEAIARNPHAPQKIFSIGRVFRRETVDYKHLPEFMQVDGIIIDEKASFASLLGTLETFYHRMGIPEVAFKPDFFPYTEPSVGVQIKWGGQWFEMAGAGVFRPEVTEPFGCKVPVLAWGGGLERLAMAIYNVNSIKDLYQSDLDWLKDARLSGIIP
ncbi:phenylalanine--tRNA ligase subunit alpha [bacterium]|nr:phenylalanine--tRNA ligase subunit alpha [bacterium]